MTYMELPAEKEKRLAAQAAEAQAARKAAEAEAAGRAKKQLTAESSKPAGASRRGRRLRPHPRLVWSCRAVDARGNGLRGGVVRSS